MTAKKRRAASPKLTVGDILYRDDLTRVLADASVLLPGADGVAVVVMGKSGVLAILSSFDSRHELAGVLFETQMMLIKGDGDSGG